MLIYSKGIFSPLSFATVREILVVADKDQVGKLYVLVQHFAIANTLHDLLHIPILIREDKYDLYEPKVIHSSNLCGLLVPY